VAEPVSQAAAGIYHPKAGRAFASLDEYLAWYRSAGAVKPDAALVGILFYSNNFKFNDLAAIDALVARLERAGVGAVPVFGWPIATLRPLMTVDGQSPLRVMLGFNLGFTQADDMAEFERYGVPLMNMLTTRESLSAWDASGQGITPDRISTQLNSPERAGAIEPLMVATTEKVTGSDTTRTQGVPERIDAVVKRVQRWLALQDKANADKRIAFIYFSTPPGKGYLGASYLNLMPSLVNLLQRLKDEGYRTGTTIPDEQALIDTLTQSGRNIEEWAPGELAEMARHTVLVPMAKYRAWYATLPREFRQAVEQVWGPPERSTLMTVRTAGAGRSFVVPGLLVGNMFLGPQPLRTTYERAVDVQHDTLTPPPHSYIAAYLWYRYELKADAVVHMGRHGTLEWLPGKHVGQAGWDDSEAILGDLPNPYYFIIDGGGEAIQARRRSAGVMIGHLTPLIVPAGKQEEYAPLAEALDGYAATVDTSPEVAEEYQRQVIAAVRALKLDRQLGIDLESSSWEQIHAAVEQFSHDIEEGPTPMGQHTIGALPGATVQRDGLQEFLRTAFQPAEQKQLGGSLGVWADALFGDTSSDAAAIAVSTSGLGAAGFRDLASLREKAVTILGDGATWIENIRRSPGMELDALVTVLRGGYLPSGPLGDPLRSPASIPSGRNLHDLDTALIPTKAAWEIGKRMADKTIARFKTDTGRTPEKISMVLWYGETARSRGVMEAEAMWLMGVEPRWNARGVVDSLRLVPDAELGRPRVDVIYTVSGIYRDGFGDKILWLDRAARLAASAGDNAISRHDRQVSQALIASGVAPAQAVQAATARVFGAAPGMYGVGGIEQIVSRSLDEGEEKGIAEMYLHHMNYAYSEKVWGASVSNNLTEQLKGNDAIVHSRTTYVYGVLDNDDFYQFAGGLNSASKAVNGVASQFYVNNLRGQGRENVESFRNFLVKELTTSYWNPAWIKEQKNAGYAGARQFIKEMEHLYGFQATSKEQVDGQLWQKSYDVYVADKHGLDMDAFFEKANPYVRQWQLSRLLEVDRQGSYQFTAAERGVLMEKYVRSVIAHGAACSSNTCGNVRLHQFIATQAPLITGLGEQEMRAFAAQMGKATRWNPAQFSGAPMVFRQGLADGVRQSVRIPPPAGAPSRQRPRSTQTPPPAPPSLPTVTGAAMSEQVIPLTQRANGSSSRDVMPLLAVALLIGSGLLLEWRRSIASR
jgi:cobaltochelatase CobN